MIPVDATPLYEQRIIVLLETAPQSNKYYQVCLNETQFKQMTEAVGRYIKLDNIPQQLYQAELDTHTVVTLPSEFRSLKK